MDSIVLVRNACRDSQIGTGLSKFGGNPDLPNDFQLNFDFQFFLGQINFVQISDCGAISPLPDTGLLSLFLNLASDGLYTVEARYFASTDRLQRMLLPPKKHPCHPCRLTPHLFQSMSADICSEFLRRFYPQRQTFDFDTPWHQMFGLDQGDARILLLQVDSDSLVSMSWGYNGELQFWIKRCDLEAKNFAGIEVELVQSKRIR